MGLQNELKVSTWSTACYTNNGTMIRISDADESELAMHD